MRNKTKARLHELALANRGNQYVGITQPTLCILSYMVHDELHEIIQPRVEYRTLEMRTRTDEACTGGQHLSERELALRIAVRGWGVRNNLC